MSDESTVIRLNHILGRSRGTDISQFNAFVTWIEANLRLGRSMEIRIDKYGEATCESFGGESDQ